MDKSSAQAKGLRTALQSPLVVICAAVFLFFGSQILGVGVSQLFIQHIKEQSYQLLVIIALNALALGLLVSFVQNFIRVKLSSLGIKLPALRSLLYILPAFLIYFLASAVFTMFAIKYIPGFKSDQVQDIGFNNLKQPLQLVAGFISLAVITPLYEEFIFRGVLFKGLRRKLPFWVSAVIASVVFAVAHMQWNVAVDVFALSLVLCFLVEKSQSIFPGVLLHALKNSIAFILLFIHK